MDRFESEEIIRNLNVVDLSANKVYIFGLNKYCAFILEELRKREITVINILDNSAGKQGKIFEGVFVESPEKCLKKYDDRVKVLIASKYYDEMYQQIRSYGYEERHVYQLLYLWGNGHFRYSTFIEYLSLAKQGERMIQGIRKKYGEDAWFLYAPVISVGDIYLMSMYIYHFFEVKKKKYIFLLTGNAAKTLAGSMGLNDIEVLSKQESLMVMNYLKLNGFEKNQVILLHTGYVHTSISERLLTYKGCSWLDNYRIIFGLEKDIFKKIPSFTYDTEKLIHILWENEMETKKTVILAPYTNTVPELDKKFWMKLSEDLISAGFHVLTNVVGAENPVPGTKPITFSLEYAEAVMDKAYGFIGLRNGLCDIICNADCKKVLLYPGLKCEFLSVYEYYSFERMGIGKNLYEFCFSYDEIGEKLIHQVMDCLRGR